VSNDAFTVELAEALDPLVLGIDVGSTGTRAGIYDARGVPVHQHRHKAPHSFTTAPDGTVTIDPLPVVDEAAAGISAVTEHLGGRTVAGVAIDTFASSLVGVGRDGTPLTPCYTYADTRSTSQLVGLLGELDLDEVHDLTGTRLHTSYLAPRLRWLRETSPEVFARVDRWFSIGEFIQLRLAGATAVGTSTAAWTGLLDRRTGEWASPLLDAVGVGTERFSPLCDPDSWVEGAGTDQWPALRDARWFAPLADGLSSNIGSGATDPGTIGLAAATSGAMRVLVTGTPAVLPSGLWCYRISREQSLVGGALNDVGRVVSWLEDVVRLPEGTSLDDVARRAPDAGTPIVLPFLTGERSTGWRADARGVVADIGAAADGAAVARGALEGLALSYERVHDQLVDANPAVTRVVASGRVTNRVPGLLALVADAISMPVDHAVLRRATLRGTALLALDVLAPDVERAPTPIAVTESPDPDHAAHYATRRGRFADLYDRLLS